MQKGILVFAAKKGGLDLFEYLLSIDAPVDRVIAASAADTAIMEMASSRKIHCTVHDRDMTSWLPAEGHTYAWLLNLWSPHILRAPVLSLAKRRLNVHPSLAPFCRGNDNAAWTLRGGVPAGVSLMEMGERVDDGDIYIQRQVPYSFPMEGKKLNAQLLEAAGALFRESWPAIFAGDISPQPQQGEATYHTRKDTEEDRVRGFSSLSTVGECLQWILAHDFSPGTTAEVHHEGERYKVTVSVQKV